MRINPIPLIAFFLLFSTYASSQKDSVYSLHLKNGSFFPQKNISIESIDEFNRKVPRFEGQSFAVIQFDHIPSANERKQLLQAGIELMDYIPQNAYSVSIKNLLSENILKQAKARSVFQLTPQQKMSSQLANGIVPSWAIKTQGTVDLWISYPRTLSYESVIQELQKRNFDIVSSSYKNYRVIALRIAMQRLNELASLPFIEFVQPAPPQDQSLNNNSRDDSRANVLNASVLNGGYDLHGENIVVGVGDNADPLQHIDFANRIINRNAVAGGAHGLHVMGTVGGAGIIEEKYAGYASKSTILSQTFSNVFTNASTYFQDYGMVITNNSYGAIVNECSYNGLYDLYSRILDQQAFDLPYLENVFAAGNSGAMSCSPYPSGFNTVLGGYQAAKNIIDVGNTTKTGTVITASSKGPMQDGRIKPEISAMGTSLISCWVGFPYIQNTGTSMSSPGVSGGLALLYQRYRQLNGNANPKNALMKAVICNGADDKGNVGPDFSYGFGWMNLLRSIDMLNNNHYFSGSINNGDPAQTHVISVPANVAQLKVMLYWNDPAASAVTSKTLVNDLDLEVVTPSSATVLPLILDTIPANVNNAATTGADHINNIEQIVINNPAVGNYKIRVKPFAIVQNPPQEYFVVYDFVPVSTTLTYPVGGENMLPGDSVLINWDSYGDPANPFTVQFSFDNGNTWIDSSVSANLRQLLWHIPITVTDQAKVRITRNGTALSSTSSGFTIIDRPVVSLAPVQCESYIAINWTTVSGATDYEVMMLRGDQMVSIATTNSTSYTFSGLSKDSVYWVTVRARINGKPGMRATAISRQPNNGTCAGTISDNDLKMDAIIAPASGRIGTSTALPATTAISARIKNLDDAPINSFDMKYSVNGGPWMVESVSTPIAAGATYTYNFAATYDFSAVGVYVLKVVVKNTSAVDPVPINDTLVVTIKQLANPAITLTIGSDFLDNIETATNQTYYSKQIGLDGLDRYDFVSSTVYGRLRTFINTGIAYSGTKAITLDADRYNGGGTIDSLTGTFNLTAHDVNADDIRLDFQFKNHGQLPHAENKVWIRGNDQQPWIQVYDLYANQNDPGTYKKSSSIEISRALNTNSQNFSSGFQIRWGQWGQIIAADNAGGAGYTFDDIHLYKVVNDLQMISIDTPGVNNCGLNATTPIKVTVRNSTNNTVSNIPIKYRIDGGSIVSETISSIGGNASLQYTFATPANLSANGSHTIQAWVDYPADSYRGNDSALLSLVNSPVISSFPYLENFENGKGSWYSGGTNNTWEYGTPASYKMKSAASGSKAWKTRLAGNYNDLELSYLYSPCFDISGLTIPTLSFSVALDLEDCGPYLCDAAWVEYSADGVTWTKLGAFGSGTNWYNKNYSSDPLWSIQNYTKWHVATIPLPTGLSKLRLRFVMNSDESVNREGIAVDDIHIYDNTKGIYNGPTMLSPVTQNVSGNSWIDFTSGGKLVASIQPNNQTLGSTDVQAYIDTGSVRYTSTQYYHKRNITIIPANYSPNDSATVRFYFLDSETEALLNSVGCSTCSKPSSAYELGVSKYTDTANRSAENGTLLDDVQGLWLFINSSNAVKVPFDKGYYAEFKVKDFSEFWLSNGGFSRSVPLPVKFLTFDARKQPNNDVLVLWRTVDEFNIDRYEIEVARNTRDYQSGNFVKIGVVASRGNTTTPQDYNFTDVENFKAGVRYYRLKIVESDGRFHYSNIHPIVFTDKITWTIYPNPSNGIFNLAFQQNPGDMMSVKVYDAIGKMIQQYQLISDGFVQKLAIDLHQPKYASGLYMIVAEGSRKQVFKVLKQ
jgi:hypothetical protein